MKEEVIGRPYLRTGRHTQQQYNYRGAALVESIHIHVWQEYYSGFPY